MKATHQPPVVDTTPPVDPHMTAATLLRGAAAYLRRHGWTQGEFYALYADTDGPFPPACASGAIMTAAHGRCLADGMCTIDGHENPETVAAITAMRYFAAWLDLEYWPTASDTSAIDVIGDWNDDDGRTLDEVAECLTAAADDYDRTHHTRGAQ